MNKDVTECGMVPTHAEVFKKIADEEDLVLISRALNPESTALLMENYAAKGFHIKAKTCSFGPMAGFVCVDPRFTKSTDPKQIDWQKKEVEKAFAAQASRTQICVSSKRLAGLESEKQIRTIEAEGDRKLIESTSPSQERFLFVLLKRGELWALYYEPSETKKPGFARLRTEAAVPEKSAALVPVSAMVNPGSGQRGYRDAIAGDYDLFALYPKEGSSHDNLHGGRNVAQKAKVAASASPQIKELARAFTEISSKELEREHEHMGNITPLLTKIKQSLNKGIKSKGYQGGDVVMHSDETGNPFSAAPDYPLLAFVPSKPPRAIHNQAEFMTLVKEVRAAGYRATLNPNWRIPNFTVGKK